MRRLLTVLLGGLVLSCQGPAAVMAADTFAAPVVIPDAAKAAIRDGLPRL